MLGYLIEQDIWLMGCYVNSDISWWKHDYYSSKLTRAGDVFHGCIKLMFADICEC